MLRPNRPARRNRDAAQFSDAAGRDITGRQRAEQEVREARDLLAGILNNTHVLMACLDHQFNFVAVNDRYAAMDGRPVAFFPGRNHFALYPDPRLEQIFRQVLATGVPHYAAADPFPGTGATEGASTWWDWSLMPIHDPQGGVRHLVLTLLDVTERVKAEQWQRQFTGELERRVAERTRALEVLTRELQEESTARLRLQQELLSISEREQRRIGQDLHDGLGQHLTGIGFLISTLHERLRAAGAREAAAAGRINNLLQEGLEQLRQLARGLHPVAANEYGLLTALQELAAQTHQLRVVQCRFVCQSPVLCENHAVATNLYRIAQEAVQNALKHGQANRLQIGLQERRGTVRLRIRNNGSPLPADGTATAGMGLAIMRHRANTMGATLTVRNARGRLGVIVECAVPAARCRQE